MDERQTVLPLTVHLLANSGDSLNFQLAVERILQQICPGVPLFLVSERAAPIKLFEHHKKKAEFPGISVTLFLREDLGEQRIELLQSFFQLPPWNHIDVNLKQKNLIDLSQSVSDYFSLDLHMPVWEMRQVHYGTDIVRLTLYCSCDNYEDAVRLYETILKMEATSQRAGFCFFVLYTSKHVAVQLSLKQLHPGISVQVKYSCALQFTVQAVGQLVPLLPYPCVPISDSRWQTQDYEGNKILLLVVGSTTMKEAKNVCKAANELSVNPNSPSLLSFMIPKRSKKTDKLEKRNCRDASAGPYRALDRSETIHSDGSHSQNMVTTQGIQMKETESNVDTGYTVVNLTSQQAFLCKIPSDLQTAPDSQDVYFSTSTDRTGLLDLPINQEDSSSCDVIKRCKGSYRNVFNKESACVHHNINEEDEFFI